MKPLPNPYGQPNPRRDDWKLDFQLARRPDLMPT